MVNYATKFFWLVFFHLRVQTIDCDERQLFNLNSAADLSQVKQRALGEIW